MRCVALDNRDDVTAAPANWERDTAGQLMKEILEIPLEKVKLCAM